MTRTTIDTNPAFIEHSESKDNIARQFLLVKMTHTNNSRSHQNADTKYTVNNLDEAKKYLRKSKLSELPELIILETPLNLNELTYFKDWLSKNLIPSIPVIYKENSLSKAEIKKLFQLHLIDDVIKNDTDLELLHRKIMFFKSLAVQALIEPGNAKKTKKISTPVHREFFKRATDILISALILLIISPVLILIALLIKLTSKGPIIYKSKRAGEGFRVFDFYKFRTMITGADEMLEDLHNQNMYNSSKGNPSFFKVSNDPRITKFGQFLRDTSMDELPQLFNVLKGDMSLVGNRPLPLYEAATLTTSEFAERFMAPAGITGLWQISKRGKPEMSAEERISLDITYARNRSTRTDLRILLTTPSALIQKQSQ